MDKERQIRMLIPPFFFIASLLLGAYTSNKLPSVFNPPLTNRPQQEAVLPEQAKNPATKLNDSKTTTAASAPLKEPPKKSDENEGPSIKNLLSFFALVGLATLPIGYAIGVITISTLRLLFFIFSFAQWSWEIPISKDAMKRVFAKINRAPDKKYRLQAAAIFDHVLTHPNAHSWLLRRWTSFLISMQCFVALALSLSVAPSLKIPWNPPWMWAAVILSAFFLWNAGVTWFQSYRMFNFLTETKKALRKDAEDLGGGDNKLKFTLNLPSEGSRVIPARVLDPKQPIIVYQLDEANGLPNGQTATIAQTQRNGKETWQYYYKRRWEGVFNTATEALAGLQSKVNS
jgi:hypothetical protein